MFCDCGIHLMMATGSTITALSQCIHLTSCFTVMLLSNRIANPVSIMKQGLLYIHRTKKESMHHMALGSFSTSLREASLRVTWQRRRKSFGIGAVSSILGHCPTIHWHLFLDLFLHSPKLNLAYVFNFCLSFACFSSLTKFNPLLFSFWEMDRWTDKTPKRQYKFAQPSYWVEMNKNAKLSDAECGKDMDQLYPHSCV